MVFQFSFIRAARLCTIVVSCISHVFATDSLNSILPIDAFLSFNESYATPDSFPLKSTVFSAAENRHDTAQAVELDNLVVSTSRRQRLLETSQSLSVISPEEWIGTNKSVADVIAEQPGVQTRRYGGTGSFQSVSIRGVQGSEVLVLLDGIPLNSAMGGAVDLGKINPMHLREIELYKGIIPGTMGGNSIGGAINLRSKPVTQGNTFDISTELGSYGRQRLTAGVFSGAGKSVSLYDGASYSHSENNFPYLDRNNTIRGTLIDPRLDDTVRTLRNNQFTSFDISLHPSYVLPVPDKRMTGGVFISHATLHIPAPEGKVNETARYRENKAIASVSLQSDSFDSGFVAIPRLGYSRIDGMTEWTNIDMGFSTSHGVISRYGRSGIIDQSLNFDLDLRYRLSKHLRVNSLLFAQGCDANPVYDRDGTSRGDWHSRNANGGAALETQLSVHAFGVSLGGSVKGMHDETEGGLDGVTGFYVPAADTLTALWSATAGVSLKPSENAIIFLNAARYSDEPSLRERYGAKGAIRANPELLPEVGYSGELGLKWELRRLYLECTGFYTKSLNSIIFDSDGYLIRPVNNAGARNYGIEWKSDVDLTGSMRAKVSGTWQKTENRQHPYKGKLLPGEPELTIWSGLETQLLKKLSVSYDLELKTFYYRDRFNSDVFRVPAQVDTSQLANHHLYHNTQLVWNASESFECRVTGRNLTLKRPGSPGATIEGGYSWILYPVDEWSFAASYSF